MRSPTLDELPPPPPDRSGWPWTEETMMAPACMLDSGRWPKVTVVTPSYNQAQFLEETIRSVLLQGYPNLEYIVMDGGSTDGSVDIIRKYSDWLAYWVSALDGGQSKAINRGFERATGEIFGWLNSDDVYEPGALQLVVEHFQRERECELLYGHGSYVDVVSNDAGPCDWIQPFDRRLLLTFNFILQPAAFWRRSLWEKSGRLDPTCHYAMDWEWLIRASAEREPHFVPAPLARWRITPDIKTLSGGRKRRAEIARISRQYGGIMQPTYLVYQLDRMSWVVTGYLGDNRVGRALFLLSSPIRWLLKERLWKGRFLS